MTIAMSHCNLLCEIFLMIHKCLTTCKMLSPKTVKCTLSTAFHVCLEYTLMSNNALRMCVIQFSVTVRNAGNVIPHSQHFLDEATTTEPAALELGCIVNDIKHVIVCGHSDCKVNKSYRWLVCALVSHAINKHWAKWFNLATSIFFSLVLRYLKPTLTHFQSSKEVIVIRSVSCVCVDRSMQRYSTGILGRKLVWK